MRDIVAQICDITPKNYYNWKNKSHIKLINLLEKYFSEEDLDEFLKTGKIDKMENINYVADFPFYIRSIFHHITAGDKDFDLFNTLPAVIVEFNKTNNSPFNLFNEFLKFLNQLDFSSISSLSQYNFDQNELKLHLAHNVSKVSILEFFMLVKNINLLEIENEDI